MATVVQSNAVSVGNTACTPVLNSVVAGNGLGLFVATYGGAVGTPTNYTLDWSQQNGNDSNGRIYHFRRENVGSGTHSVALGSYSGGATAVLYEVGNTPTSSTADGTPSAVDDTSSPYTTPSITIAADSMILSGLTHISATQTLTEGDTLVYEQEDNSTHMVLAVQKRGDGGGLTAGSYTEQWTAGGAIQSSLGITSWKNAASGGNTLSGGPTLAHVTVAGTLSEVSVLSGGPTLAGVSLAGTLVDTNLSGGPTLASVTIAGSVLATIPGLSGGPTLANITVAGTLVEHTGLSGGPTLASVTVAGTLAEVYTVSGGPTLSGIQLIGTLADSFVSSGPTLAHITVSGSLTITVAVGTHNGGPPVCFSTHSAGTVDCLTTHALGAVPNLAAHSLSSIPNLTA